MKYSQVLVVALVIFLVAADYSEGWSGNYYSKQATRSIIVRSCSVRSWWGCGYWRYHRRTIYQTEYSCQPGWTHNGDQNCTIQFTDQTETPEY